MMKKMNLDRRLMLTLAAVTALGAQQTMGAGIWSAGTGNWSTGTNWDDSNVPSAVAVTLGDVASGTRTVTYDSVNPSVVSLAMTQNTLGATNALALTANLDLTGSGTPFNQTRGSGVGVASLQTSITNGAVLQLTNVSTTKIFSNAGTLNLGDGTTTGTVQLATTGTINNTGVINFNGGSLLRSGSTTGFTVANGTTTDSTPEMRFLGGTNRLGIVTNSDTRANSLSNYGTVSISNGATLEGYSNTTNGGATSNFSVLNRSTGTFIVGSSTTSGVATLVKQGASNSGTVDLSITNEGSMSVYGQSYIQNAMASDKIVISNTGSLNFVGDATGIRVGGTAIGQVNVTNTGTLSFSRFTGTGAGATGEATLGILGTAVDSNRGSATLTNSVGGTANFGVDTNSRLRSKRSANNYFNSTLVNDGTLNLGASGSSASGATLGFLLATGSGNGNADTGLTGVGKVTNTGTANLYGTSALRLDPGSVALNDQSSYVTFIVENNSGANLNLFHSATVGQNGSSAAQGTVGGSDYIGAKPMRTVFTNAGTVTKLGSGAAAILSSTGGTADNTGTIDVQAGSLEFSSALSNSAGGLIKGNGTLITPTLTSVGTIAPGASVGNLAITGDVVVGDSGVVAIEVVNDTFDVLAIDGDLNLSSLLDTLTVNATGSQTLARLAIITYTGDLSVTGIIPDKFNTETLTGFAVTASIDYSVPGEIAVVVPEPSTLAFAGLAGLGLLRRRR